MTSSLLAVAGYSTADPDVFGVALFLLAVAGIVTVLCAPFYRHLPSQREAEELEAARVRLQRPGAR